MDRYKKTALKFDKNLGYGRNLRAAEINSSRAVLRNSRFSMQRCLDLEPEEEHKPESRIPAFGKSALKAPLNREQMLQKWKAEKEMKRQLELQNKKPTFKIGVSAPKSGPVSSPFNKAKADSTFLSTKNSQKISFNATHLSKGKENGLKPPSIAKFQASNITHKKTPQSKESHIQMVSSKHPTASVNISSGKKESQARTVNSKPAITHFSTATAKKESQIKTFNSNFKPPTTHLSNSNVKKEFPGKSINSKPPVTSLSNSSGKRVSPIQAVNSKLSAPNSSNSSAQKIKPLTGIKPIQSKVFRKPEQTQPSLLGRIPNRVPEPKIKLVSQQNSGNSRMLKAPSKLAAPVRSGIPNKTGLKPKTEIKLNKKEDMLDSNITFSCNISTIEPVEEKSFAPKDFTFNLGAELSFSYLDEGPIALYNKLKAGEERTSTPKRKEIIEIQRKEAEIAKENTEEKRSETEQVSEPQVTKNAIPEVSPHQNITTCSESKDTEAVTKILTEDIQTSMVSEKPDAVGSVEENSEVAKILTEDNVSIPIVKESVAVELIAEKPEIDCSVTKNCLEDEPLTAKLQPENCVSNVREGLSVIEESQNSSLAKPSVEEHEVDELITNPTSAKQVTLEINENACSAALNDKTNISLENLIDQVPVSDKKVLSKQENLIFDTTKALDKKSSVPSYEEKENVPEDVFDAVQKVDKTEHIGLDDVIEKEPLKSKLDKLIALEELGAPVMSGISGSSDIQFKIPVFEGDAGIVAKRRSSSRVSNMSLRLARRSEMPQLESISESNESSSPCKTPPKPPKTPKTRKSTISKDFTPRRSLRLARSSVLETTENLFDVRVSLCRNSPDLPGNSSTWDASQITYDFDKLDLEQVTEPTPTPQRRASARVNKKVSLLYTPPQKGRVSTLRKSIRGDLMSFSPEVTPK
ncbi:hypothetical protein JTE90_017303 [Oedothorax gibbosus]|uniref:Uncharacterized protein n=1 Tax=Oedothorax gibbosus TaxID=931172 RepID=A0AAV6UBZ2_9ARAC|nr:hypothetical protein JTE90_017303 [Oedothorax gibbosus]